MDIKTAVGKLSSQFPLKQRQDKLPPPLKSVHQNLLYSLIKQGRPLTHDELAALIDKENIGTVLQTLGNEDLIVLDASRKRPLGAYPVTLEQTPHKISVNNHTIYAMCALDAVSIAPVFNTEVLIASSCHMTDTPLFIQIKGHNIKKMSPFSDITVGIRWQMPSDVAAHSMCMEMIFLKDRRTAEDWQDNDTENISLFTLPETVEFGSCFFSPLLD